MSKECRNLRVVEDRNASSTLEKDHARHVIKNSGKLADGWLIGLQSSLQKLKPCLHALGNERNTFGWVTYLCLTERLFTQRRHSFTPNLNEIAAFKHCRREDKPITYEAKFLELCLKRRFFRFASCPHAHQPEPLKMSRLQCSPTCRWIVGLPDLDAISLPGADQIDGHLCYMLGKPANLGRFRGFECVESYAGNTALLGFLHEFMPVFGWNAIALPRANSSRVRSGDLVDDFGFAKSAKDFVARHTPHTAKSVSALQGYFSTILSRANVEEYPFACQP